MISYEKFKQLKEMQRWERARARLTKRLESGEENWSGNGIKAIRSLQNWSKARLTTWKTTVHSYWIF